MLKMWRSPFWQGFFISLALPSVAVLFVLYFHEYGFEAKHSVSDCRAIYVPVTPDGQPLDMSDPFHGEDE